MSQELDRINLYERRSISQCLETTFDFMRVNRRVWLRSTFVLIGPLALLLALLLTVVNMAAPEDHHAGLDGSSSTYRCWRHPLVLVYG